LVFFLRASESAATQTLELRGFPQIALPFFFPTPLALDASSGRRIAGYQVFDFFAVPNIAQFFRCSPLSRFSLFGVK